MKALLTEFKTEVVVVHNSMTYESTLYGATQDDKRLTIVFSLMDDPAETMRVNTNMTLTPDKEWTTEEAIAFMLFVRGFINCAIECL